MATNFSSPDHDLLDCFAKSQAPIYLIDSQRNIRYANASLAEWIGLSAEVIAGRSVAYHSELETLPQPAGQVAGLCPPPAVLAGNIERCLAATVSALGRDGRLRHRTALFTLLPNSDDTQSRSVLAICDSEDLSPQQLAAGQRGESTADRLHAIIARFRHRAQQDGLPDATPLLVGDSPVAAGLRRKVEVATASRANLLITGPHASERTELARTLFYRSQPGPDARLVPLDASLLNAELVAERISLALRAAEASDVTLLVENVHTLSVEAQHAIVAATQQHPLLRVIGTAPTECEDLQPAFKAVLLTFAIEIPALIHRSEDLPLLAQWCVEACNAASDKQIGGLTPSALDLMHQYGWPGGMAQLEQVISEAHAKCEEDSIDTQHLPQVIQHAAMVAQGAGKDATRIDLAEYLANIERELVLRALQAHNGNKSDAAKALGLTRPRLYRRLASLGLESPDGDASINEP